MAEVDYLSIAVLGAGPGDIVRGVFDSELRVSKRGIKDTTTPLRHVEGVRLQVVEGYARPELPRVEACLARHGADGWDKLLAAHLGVTPSVARQVRGQAQALSAEPLRGKTTTPIMGCCAQSPVKDPTQYTAKFRVLSSGTAWSDPALRKLALSGDVVDANHLAHLLEAAHVADSNHPAALGLRPYMWTRTVATRRLTADEVDRLDAVVDKVLVLDSDDYAIDTSAVYWVALDTNTVDPDADSDAEDADGARPTGFYIRAPAPDAAKATDEQVLQRVLELAADHPNEEVERCWNLLSLCGTQALFKSMLQKLVRLRPRNVRLPEVENDLLVTERVMYTCTLGQCYTKRGNTFNTDIGKYVRGTTAMLKRMAVCIIEDGGDVCAVPWLLGMALLTELDPSYHLPVSALDALVAICTVFGADSTDSVGGVLPWRSPMPAETQAALDAGRVSIDDYSIPRVVCEQYLLVHPIFLDLGGMRQDKAMMRDAAALFCAQLPGLRRSADCTPCGSIDLLDPASRTVACDGYTMPFEHCIDQHAVIGVMHVNASLSEAEATDPHAFGERFKAVWAVTGHNVRTRGVCIDEEDAAVRRVRFAQRTVMADLLRTFSVGTLNNDQSGRPQDYACHFYVSPAAYEVAHVSLSPTVLAGAIGDLQKIVVKTTREENVVDGFVGEFAGYTTWNLIACFDTESGAVHVAHKPTAHANGGHRKPALSERVAKRAREQVWARAKAGLPIQSAELEGFHKATMDNSTEWTIEPSPKAHGDLSTFAWHVGSGPVRMPVRLRVMKTGTAPVITDVASARSALANDELVLGCVAYDGPAGIVGGREYAMTAVISIVESLTERQQRRLVAVVQNAYKGIVMPTMPRTGSGIGSDQTSIAEAGDWDVWRALVVIARFVPLALRPNGIPKFRVINARAMRLVADWVRDARGPRQAVNRLAYPRAWEGALEAVAAKMKERGVALTDYQERCLEVMKARDGDFDTRGSPVTLDTGLGKTIVAALYCARYIAERATAKHVLWFTQSTSIKGTGAAEAHVTELQSWGFPNVVHVRSDPSMGLDALTTLRGAVEANAKRVETALPHLFVLGYELLSSGGGRDALVSYLKAIAPMSVVCLDEAHLLFNVGTLRGASAISIAKACARLVLTTATPTGTTRQKGARELFQLTTPFEVTDRNMLTAASRNLGRKQERRIKEKDVVRRVDVDHAVRAQSMEHAKARRWLDAASVVREALRRTVAAAAISLADLDRRTNEGGGVVLVAENIEEVEAYVSIINEKRGRVFAAIQGPAVDANPQIGVVVQVLRRLVSVNMERLGVMLSLPIPSNHNDRHQARGRLLRELTQKRDEVTYVTLVPENTVLEILLERQQCAESRAATYESVGLLMLTGAKKRKQDEVSSDDGAES